jgi:hypothetical protein
MEQITTESANPIRLLCGGCRHWEETAIRAVPTGELVGRCDRFSETRFSTARPRCNICWEPRSSALRAVEANTGNAG